MGLSIDNITTQNDFVPANAFGQGTPIVAGWYIVANAVAGVRLTTGIHGQPSRQDEVICPPGVYPIQSNPKNPITTIEFRSFLAGTPAQVVGALFFPSDSFIQAGGAFDSQITPGGGVTPPGGGVSIPRYTIAAFLALAPADGDFAVVEINATVNWFFQWVASNGRWQFLGGPPLLSASPTIPVVQGGGVASPGLVLPPDNEPEVALPFLGDYFFSLYTGFFSGSPNTSAGVTVLINGVGLIAVETFTSTGGLASINMSEVFGHSVAGAGLETTYYNDSPSNVTFLQRWLMVTPFDVQQVAG